RRRRQAASGGDRRQLGCRCDDRAGPPRRGVRRILRRPRAGMNGPLFRHTWRTHRIRLAVVSIALMIWGFVTPMIYARYGTQFTALMDSGILPQQFTRFGSGDIFSLPGSIALGFI